MLVKTLKQYAIYDVIANPQHYKFVFILTGLTLLVMLFEPFSGEWLRYQIIEVSNGQWWRIVSANLCHSNWNHWMLNLAGLWIMDIFYQPVLSAKYRSQLLVFCMVLNVLMLHLFLTIHWYVGLSGALHGYLIGAAIMSWNQTKLLTPVTIFRSSIEFNPKWLNFIIILGTVFKLIVESVWEINLATEKLIGANVLEEAHSFGAIAAIVFAFVFLLLKDKVQKSSKS